MNILNNSQASSREDDVIFTEKTKKSKNGLYGPNEISIIATKIQ